MKRRVIFVSILLVFTAGIALAQVQDFYLYNDNDYSIHYIYVSPSNSDSWDEDVLGDDILYAWESLYVSFSGYRECYFDILIIDEYGDEGIVYDVNLCGITAIHFEWDYDEGIYYYWTE